MGIFREDEEGRIPTRRELIRLVNIWLDLEIAIHGEVGPQPKNFRGAFERGRAAGVAVAAQDLLELLGIEIEDDPHDDETWMLE